MEQKYVIITLCISNKSAGAAALPTGITFIILSCSLTGQFCG